MKPGKHLNSSLPNSSQRKASKQHTEPAKAAQPLGKEACHVMKRLISSATFSMHKARCQAKSGGSLQQLASKSGRCAGLHKTSAATTKKQICCVRRSWPPWRLLLRLALQLIDSEAQPLNLLALLRHGLTLPLVVQEKRLRIALAQNSLIGFQDRTRLLCCLVANATARTFHGCWGWNRFKRLLLLLRCCWRWGSWLWRWRC